MVDTSVFIELERRGLQPAGLNTAYPDASFAMSAITASELLVGVHRANSQERRRGREASVERLLQAIQVVSLDLRVARQHAVTWALLLRTGQVIKAHDLLIAATALAHGFTVLTRDLRDFPRVPGLAVQVFSGNVSEGAP
jgi:tRNA(fMet)-specific endonuclease VapC